jgi:hypothetical protein
VVPFVLQVIPSYHLLCVKVFCHIRVATIKCADIYIVSEGIYFGVGRFECMYVGAKAPSTKKKPRSLAKPIGKLEPKQRRSLLMSYIGRTEKWVAQANLVLKVKPTYEEGFPSQRYHIIENMSTNVRTYDTSF